MKTLTALFTLCSAMAFSQISFSGKANLIFPTGSPSWKNISATATGAYEGKGKNAAGFNVGVSAKVGLPKNLFVMPELYFTTFKNEFTDKVTNTKLQAKSNRIDVPVLVGYNLLGNQLGIFAGPVASYNLSTDDTYNDFKENAKSNFTVGYQFGAQAEIKKIIINARYEGAFSKDQRDFIRKTGLTDNYTVRYDARPSLFIVGAGYKF